MPRQITQAARPRVLVCSTVATVLLAVAGCGADGDRGLSRKEYIAQADAICAKANEQEAALRPGAAGWHYGAKFDDPQFLSRFTAVGRAAERQLRRLSPPEEERRSVDEMLRALRRLLASVRKRIDALEENDRGRAVAALNEFETAYDDVAVTAGSAGITQCQGLGI